LQTMEDVAEAIKEVQQKMKKQSDL
jgi:hypothetical protein